MKRRNPRERYRVDFKLRALAALDANEGCIYRTANQLGIPKSTLRLWREKRDEIHVEIERQRKQRGLLLEDQFGVMIEQIANTMQERIAGMSLMDGIRGVKLLLELNESLVTKREAQERRSGNAREKLERLLDKYAAEHEAADKESSAESA